MKKIFIIAIMIVPFVLQAQTKSQARKQKKAERAAKVEQLIKQEEEGALIFQKQGAFGLKFNTDGFSMFYEHGKYKTITKTNLWWIELGERKDAKQYRSTVEQPIGPFVQINSYVFGKQNNFYYFKFGLGQQQMLGGKGTKNGVAVSAIYGGGLSLGMLKPYYLEVVNRNAQTTDEIKYADNDPRFLNYNFIAGSATFGKGFNEMKFVPGAHARVALRFDYGRYNETLSALEVGLNAEYYSKNMPIMVGVNEDKKFFLNAYIAIVFGHRK